MLKNPCAKDCPERNEICHTVCKQYKEFVNQNNLLKIEKAKYNQLCGDLRMHRLETVRRCSNYRIKV